MELFQSVNVPLVSLPPKQSIRSQVQSRPPEQGKSYPEGKGFSSAPGGLRHGQRIRTGEQYQYPWDTNSRNEVQDIRTPREQRDRC